MIVFNLKNSRTWHIVNMETSDLESFCKTESAKQRRHDTKDTRNNRYKLGVRLEEYKKHHMLCKRCLGQAYENREFEVTPLKADIYDISIL